MNNFNNADRPRLVQNLQSKPIREQGKNLMMRVGERIHLELLDSSEGFWAELTGFKQGSFLIALLPNLPRHRQSFATESMVSVRGLNKDFQLCGFTTTIAKVMTAPYPLLFLKFPEEYDKYHLRRHERVNCFLPATVIFDSLELKSTVINLSLGGARIALDPFGRDITPKHLERQEIFLLSKAGDADREICSKIFVLDAEHNGDLILLRTEFIDFIGDTKDIIREFVSWMKKSSSEDHGNPP